MTTNLFLKESIMQTTELLAAIETRSAEIKNEQQEIATRLTALERKGLPNIHGASDASTGLELKSLVAALGASGNMTAKASVQVSKSTLLQGVSAGYLNPVSQNIGVFAQAEQLSIASQIHSFGTTAAIIDYSVLTTADSGAIQVKEGDLKKQLDIVSTPKKVEMLTHAGWVKISTQALADQQNISQALGSIMYGAIARSVDANIVATAIAEGTTGATMSTPLLSALGAVAQIQSYGKSGVVFVNPIDFAAITLSVNSNGDFIQVPQAYAGVIRAASGVAQGTYLATSLDGSGLDLAVNETVGIDIGTSGDDFLKNLRVLLAESRAVALIRDANLVVTGSLSAAKAK